MAGIGGDDVQYTLSLKDLLTGKLLEADKAAGALGVSMGAVQSIALAMGATAGVAGIGMFISSMVQAGTKVEDARVGLTTLLRDADAAGKVIENTMQDATKTPFAFEGLLAANKALIGAGESADGSRVAVLDLANAIAATGGGDDELQRMVVNMQQIKNTGQATALDIKQFAFAGINIYKVLAEATGKPIEKVKDMKVTYELLTQALAKAHAQGGLYANGLENMAGNTSVRLSNIGDAMFQLKVKIFDDLKPAIDSVIQSGMNFVSNLREGWDWLVKHKAEIKAVAIGVGAATAAYITYNIWQRAVVTWEELKYMWMMRATIAETLMTSAQWLLNAAITANPIGVIVVAIGAFVAALVYAYEKVSWFHAGLWGIWATIKTFGEIVKDVFMGITYMLDGAFKLDPKEIELGFNLLTDTVAGAGKRLAGSFQKGYAEGMADFNLKQGAEGEKVTAKGTQGKTGKEGKPAEELKAPKSSGTKNVTINISINKLIETFKVETTNLHDSANKIGEHVTNTILQAVNDASITADV